MILPMRCTLARSVVATAAAITGIATSVGALVGIGFDVFIGGGVTAEARGEAEMLSGGRAVTSGVGTHSAVCAVGRDSVRAGFATRPTLGEVAGVAARVATSGWAAAAEARTLAGSRPVSWARNQSESYDPRSFESEVLPSSATWLRYRLKSHLSRQLSPLRGTQVDQPRSDIPISSACRPSASLAH